MPHQQHRGTAVVIGAGICGLATARVLTDHFAEVVLVEQDTLPADDSHRAGVPQARHVHGLLASGAGHLERLFPGLRQELNDKGAPVYDHLAKARTKVWAGTLPARPVGIEVQTVHRDMLEGAIRRRVTGLPKVTVRDGSRVAGLHMEGGVAAGIVLADGSDEGEVLRADLVVDASGRFTKLPDWLEDAGFPRPAETVVDGSLAYATRLIRIEEPPEPGVHGLQQMNQAPDRPGGMYAGDIGQGRWIVTLFGAGGQHPPLEEGAWREFAAGLDNQQVDKLLANSELLPGAHQYKRTENRRREYTKMRRWPGALVALGDSHCAYNPVYGQGMTVGVMQAVELGEALAAGVRPATEARRLQRRAAKLARIPWLMSTSEDRVWACAVQGKRPGAVLRMTAWYKQRLLHLAVHDSDPRIVTTFVRVFHMLSSPAAMGRPGILLKVLTKAKSPAPARAAGQDTGAASRG